VSGALRYLWVLSARTRAPLLPLAVALFVLIGVFLDPRQDPGAAWGVTAALGCGVVALLVGSILGSEPAPQAEMATVALGDRGRRRRLDAVLVAVTGAGLSAAAIAYPLLLKLARPDEFDRHLRLGDVAGAAVVLLACTLLGGGLGVLFAPPRVTRRATAVAATVATVLALVAASGPLGWASGPAGAAEALSRAPAGRLTAHELAACLICVVLTGAAALLARWWSHRAS
jgi:hypothetical protein